ncbi:MAG: ATP-binding cassette domain-containing protein [Clostridia bacterium]|nr:ATP-binding cassette domain-containing protein [Clostridia bacterium]
MLETLHLTKTYKPKKGVPVKALDDVSLRFPETGMVFLLGKSGSGKSTLLNLLGGLDKADGGEIIIKGVSSKTFKQEHFDSYRNTYLGFIFQEYNVLDDFSVGANIALAIELQGRRATDEELNKILEEVDLAGYGSRRPNELSGGQKQRVAIARALVKNPEIIMADEPTGALDSATGKQVLDTLRKLSKNKLVIAVSHDREFAEHYADRIIELADGRVIRDVEVDSEAEAETASAIAFKEESVEIPAGYHLTEEDRAAINAYIDEIGRGTSLHFAGSAGRKFRESTQPERAEDSKTFHLIKSKLPMRSAVKIGASSLRHKKFRLVVTILLSCIAFGLFGLSDTFASYKHLKACTNSIIDMDVRFAAVTRMNKVNERYGDEDFIWWTQSYLKDEDIASLREKTGIGFSAVYPETLSLSSAFNRDVELSETAYSIYPEYLYGYTELTEDTMRDLGLSLLAGRLPDRTKNEVVLSETTLKLFQKAGFRSADAGDTDRYEKIESADQLIGKKINLDWNSDVFEIVGIIDTHFNWDRYAPLMEFDPQDTKGDVALDYLLASEYRYDDNYGLHALAFVGEGYIEKNLRPDASRFFNFSHTNAMLEIYYFDQQMTENSVEIYTNADTMISFDHLTEAERSRIVWFGGAKDSLGEHDVILSELAVHAQRYLQNTKEYMESVPLNREELAAYLSGLPSLNANCANWNTGFDAYDVEWHIVGYIPYDESISDDPFFTTVVVNDGLYENLIYANDGIYSYAIGQMPKGESNIYDFVSFCYDESNNVRYEMQSAVTTELDMINEVLTELSDIFLWIGVGFAVFAAIMLANFISTSIAYKKQEIGILRAIGSRSNDVFRIFFSESFIIAMINFVFSALGTALAVFLINYYIRRDTVVIVTVLGFGIRQIALLFLVSVLVAFVASFFPVKKIASKRPIDAIRDR